MAEETSLDPLLQEVRDRLIRAFPGVRKILLFGSRARGREEAASDYDLLVVVPSKRSPVDRGTRARLALADMPAAFDIVVVTPEELDRLRHWRSSVVSHALREGIVLHEAA